MACILTLRCKFDRHGHDRWWRNRRRLVRVIAKLSFARFSSMRSLLQISLCGRYISLAFVKLKVQVLKRVREVCALSKQPVHKGARSSIMLHKSGKLCDAMEDGDVIVAMCVFALDVVVTDQNGRIDFGGGHCPRWRCARVGDDDLDDDSFLTRDRDDSDFDVGEVYQVLHFASQV